MSIRLTTVKSEIHNVLSTVRLTERSSIGSSRFESEVLLRDEAPVVRKLKSLHDYLLTFDDLEEVDAPTFLEPFLEIIRTPTSNGVVTGVVLSSLNKLLLYGSLTAESPRSAEAVNLAVEAVCNCKFEASHHYSDEVVLLQILEVLVSLLRCPVGDRLTEENAWSLVQVCYQMAVDPSLSELLRASAANHLSHVVLTVFSRASDLIQQEQTDPVSGQSRPAADDRARGSLGGESDYIETESLGGGVGAMAVYVPYNSRLLTRILAFLSKLTDPATANSLAAALQDASAPAGEALRAMGLQLINIALETAGEILGSHKDCVQIIQNDLCKFLLSNSQTDDLPVLALTLRVVYNLFSAMKGHLKVQLEVFLTSVHFRIVDLPNGSNEKKELVLESLLDFCHDPALVLDLHANYDCDVNCSNLFEGLCKLLCKNSLPGSAGLTTLNVLALEGVHSIVAQLASRCASSDTEANASGEKDENGDGQARDDDTEVTTGSKLLRDEELIVRKTLKRRLLLAASQFNKAPTKPYWREYARELGLLTLGSLTTTTSLPSSPKQINQVHFPTTSTSPAPVMGDTQAFSSTIPGTSSTRETESASVVIPSSPPPPSGPISTLHAQHPGSPISASLEERQYEELANFLLTTPGLDKSAIGEYLSEKDNKPILKKYIEKFELRDLRIDLALRRILESFRIPGEAQKIERVMEGFAVVYYEQNQNGVFASSDAVLIFAFSIMMLHTDRHSRSIPENKRMTEEQFVRNVRGINDGKDFDPQLLSHVFKSVSEHEFILSYDASGEGPREWDVVLRHSSKVEFARFSKRGHVKKAGIHERDIFEMLYEPALRTIDAALEVTQDGRVVIRTLKSVSDLARIASYFGGTDEFNQLMILLCRHFFRLIQSSEGLARSLRAHADDVEILYQAELACLEIDDEKTSARAEDDRAATLDARQAHEKQKRISELLGMVEMNAGDVSSPVRALLIARSVMHMAQSFGSCAREGWANLVRVVTALKGEQLLPQVTKDDVALSSEDQRLLSEEKSLFESRKSRLPTHNRIPSATTPTRRSAASSVTVESRKENGSGDPLHLHKVDHGHSHPHGPEEHFHGHGDSEEYLHAHSAHDHDDDEMSLVHEEEAHSPSQKSASVWNTVTSFFFGGGGVSGMSEDDANVGDDWKQSKEYRRAVKACQGFFQISETYLALVRSTWSLSEKSLAHLLTALSSPFSSSPPSWCSTAEFTPSVASSCLDTLVLVASANRSRFEQISPFLDGSYGYVLKEVSDEILVRTAVRCFFETCSLRTTAVFEMLPASFDAVAELAAVPILFKDIALGLQECRQIDQNDLQSWKMWFRILTKCLTSKSSTTSLSSASGFASSGSGGTIPLPPSPHHRRLGKIPLESQPSASDASKYILHVLDTIVEESLVFRSNVVLIADALQLIVASVTQTGVPHFPARDRKRAVVMFKRLRLALAATARQPPTTPKQQLPTPTPPPAANESMASLAEDDDALWLMLLGMLRTSWDDVEVENEVSDSLAAVLFEGVGLLSTSLPEPALAEEDKIRRVNIAFERVLFPLVAESKRKRSDAVWLLSRFFLACASMEQVGDQLVDDLLMRIIDCITADFEDPQAPDDSKESAMQTIMNIINVVVRGTPFQEQRMALVSKELDIILPAGWRDSLISTVQAEPATTTEPVLAVSELPSSDVDAVETRDEANLTENT